VRRRINTESGDVSVLPLRAEISSVAGSPKPAGPRLPVLACAAGLPSEQRRAVAASGATAIHAVMNARRVFRLSPDVVAGQNGQLPGLGASCRRSAPAGMSCTAIVLATVPLSSRTM
jgi:hypothetical protein